jgi:hypothetical protein
MQQRCRITLRLTQPCRPVSRLQDHRHAVVQLGVGVCRCARRVATTFYNATGQAARLSVIARTGILVRLETDRPNAAGGSRGIGRGCNTNVRVFSLPWPSGIA